MKKIFIFLLAFSALQVNAQERQKELKRERVHKIQDFSPEEAATIKTKKMTLELDLTEAQQKEIYKINLEEAQERQKMVDARRKMRSENNSMERADEQKFNKLNENLDRKIEHKQRMKSILNAEQYEKWTKNRERWQQKSVHKKRRMQPKQ